MKRTLPQLWSYSYAEVYVQNRCFLLIHTKIYLARGRPSLGPNFFGDTDFIWQRFDDLANAIIFPERETPQDYTYNGHLRGTGTRRQHGACLLWACILWACLSQAFLSRVCISRACISEEHLTGLHRGVALSRACIIGLPLTGVSLAGMHLMGVSLASTYLMGVPLSRACISKACILWACIS